MFHRSVSVLCASLTLLAVSSTAHAQTLVADLKFDVVGNLGLDSSGLGNDFMNNNVTSGTDRFGNLNSAAVFNGVGGTNLTRTADLTGFDGLPGYTYTAWVNRSTADTDFGGVVAMDVPGGQCCTNRLLFDGGDNPYVDSGLHQDFDFSSIVVPNGQWFHIAMTGDDTGPGNDVDIYIDGAFAGTHHYNHDLVNGTIMDAVVGSDFGNAHVLIGSLDDVQIYDGALSAEQVNNVFQFGSAEAAVPEPASIALWSLIGVGLAAGVWLRRRRK